VETQNLLNNYNKNLLLSKLITTFTTEIVVCISTHVQRTLSDHECYQKTQIVIRHWEAHHE